MRRLSLVVAMVLLFTSCGTENSSNAATTETNVNSESDVSSGSSVAVDLASVDESEEGVFFFEGDDLNTTSWKGRYLGTMPGETHGGWSEDETEEPEEVCWFSFFEIIPTDLRGAGLSDDIGFEVLPIGDQPIDNGIGTCSWIPVEEAGYQKWTDVNVALGVPALYYVSFSAPAGTTLEELEVRRQFAEEILIADFPVGEMLTSPPERFTESYDAPEATGEPNFLLASQMLLNSGDPWAFNGEVFGIYPIEVSEEEAETGIPWECWVVVGVIEPVAEGTVEPNSLSEQEGVAWTVHGLGFYFIVDGVSESGASLEFDDEELKEAGYLITYEAQVEGERVGFWSPICQYESYAKPEAVALNTNDIGPAIPLKELDSLPTL